MTPDEIRARAHATAVEETCDVCRRGHGQHWSECPNWRCWHGVEGGGCPYCREIVAADDGPDERD